MLEEDKTFRLRKRLQHTATVQNVTMFYTVAKIYNIVNIESLLSKYINSCFQMVVETESFCE